MPGKRIPALTSLTGANSATNDEVVIFDISANGGVGETKRITRAQLATGLVGDLPYTPAGFIAASTVPTAIAEIASDLAAAGGAALVGNTPAGTIAATTVQGAINEIVSDLAASGGATLVGNNPAGIISATTVQTAINELAVEKPQIVTDIAALRLLNITGASRPTQVSLTQNITAGDGGGLLRLDTSDTTSADNGGTIIVDAAGNRWKRQYDTFNPRIPNNQNTVDLRDFLDARHGRNGWTQRTAPGNGTDIMPALNDALDAVRVRGGRGTVLIPPGSWQMSQTANAAKMAGNTISGYGSMATVIYYNAASGAPFNFSGAGGYTGGGVNGVSLILENGLGNSNCYAVILQGDATFQPDQTTINDLYITTLGTSYWYMGLFAYGRARTSPQGIRNVQVTNVQIFNCHNQGAYFDNIVQWSINNLGVYAGTGTGNDIQFTGGGTANTNCTQFSLARVLCSGQFQLYNSIDFDVHGRTATAWTHTGATYGRVWLRANSALNGTPGSQTDWVVKV